MELTIEGRPSFSVTGSIVVELPRWMHALNAAERTEATAADQPELRALAAGRHPQSGDIVFITANGDLRECSNPQLCELRGPVKPTNGGQTVMIDLEIGRFDVKVEWLVSESVLLLSFGHVGHKQVTYLGA